MPFGNNMLLASPFEPLLPARCEPANDFLYNISSTFHTCIPTPLAFISNTLGLLSIAAWLFAQLPQIYKNWSISSTSGLSIFFLVEWCLGDVSNVLGALFTHQASWQVTIGSYYVFVDLCLVIQWLWYEKLRHGSITRRIYQKNGNSGPSGWSDSGMHEVVIEGVTTLQPNGAMDQTDSTRKPKSTVRPQIIFRSPTWERDRKREDEKPSPSFSGTPSSSTIYRVGSSSRMPSPSPRTILLIACLAAIVHGSPVNNTLQHPLRAQESMPTPLEEAGTVLSWMSTLLYLGSRLPQLFKNYSRKSTAGLSPQLFAAAFCGNLFYSAALATNPCAWQDFGPYGGGGWARANGSERIPWVNAALPFFLGAAGVLGLDACMGFQFVLYGEGDTKVVVVDQTKGKRWRWRKVSGWMRGWVPSSSEGKGEESTALLDGSSEHGEGYGAL